MDYFIKVMLFIKYLVGEIRLPNKYLQNQKNNYLCKVIINF